MPALVAVGLIASLLLAATTGSSGQQGLPGVALGSPVLLMVERALAFFAAWLVVLVVCAQALRGRLPTEISGRGVRYATAEGVQMTAMESERTMRTMMAEIVRLRDALLEHRGFA